MELHVAGVRLRRQRMWQTTAKLTRDDPVDTDSYWHFRWLLLAGVLLAVGLTALATGGTEGTAGTRAVGGGLTAVAVVLLIAGCRDLHHWLEKRDEGQNGYPGDPQP